MPITRRLRGTGSDGKTYAFEEHTPERVVTALSDSHVTTIPDLPSYKLSSDGSHMNKNSETEFTIVRTGVKVKVLEPS